MRPKVHSLDCDTLLSTALAFVYIFLFSRAHLSNVAFDIDFSDVVLNHFTECFVLYGVSRYLCPLYIKRDTCHRGMFSLLASWSKPVVYAIIKWITVPNIVATNMYCSDCYHPWWIAEVVIPSIYRVTIILYAFQFHPF